MSSKLLILLAIFALLFSTAAFAASRDDLGVIACQKQCCQKYGGTWQSDSEGCFLPESMNGNDYAAATNCEADCILTAMGISPNASTNTKGTFSCCCAPTAILAVLVGTVLIRK